MKRSNAKENRFWRATGQLAASANATKPSAFILVLTGIILFCNQTNAKADDANRSGPEWVREGNRLLASNQPEQALEAFDQAATLLPESAAVSYNRGIALYRLQRFEEAETALQNALRPDAPELEADVKYNLGRAAQARALTSRGDAEASLEQTERAIQFYQDALDLRPDDADAKRNLAQAEQFQGFLKKLIEMLKQEQEQEQKPDDQQSPSSQPSESDEEKQDQSGDQSDKGEENQKQEGSDSQDSKEENANEDEQKESGDSSEQQQSGQSESEDEDAKSESEQQQEGEQKPSDEKESAGEESQSQQNEASDEQESRDDRSEQQKGDDQLEDMAQSQPTTEPEQDGQESDDTKAMEFQNATTQQATSQPAETPEERTKRLSIEQALRLLQEARDKEAQRRDALRAARRRSQGRTDVDKDW